MSNKKERKTKNKVLEKTAAKNKKKRKNIVHVTVQAPKTLQTSEDKEFLKPCPFCDSENIFFHFKRLNGELHEYAIAGVVCNSCSVQAGFYFCSDEDVMIKKTAIQAWNRRAYEKETK